MKFLAVLIIGIVAIFGLGTSAEQCGKQAGGALCPNGLCCSQYGWCGSTRGSGSDVGSIITPTLFDDMLKYQSDVRCQSNGFYMDDAFIAAAQSFNGFGTTGDINTRKRELAVFLAQTSRETSGKGTTLLPIAHPVNGHVLQANNTVAEDPSNSHDISAGRVPAYGVFTNIINGGVECGHGQDDEVDNRIGY
ncbi:hypothetical protein SLEP1_g52268 [Rubroshorea leprosula]|uniref:chitinase n=1 Tax=Rubroshorea leprosula TaxID=152421 RepID=A0AAV5M5Q0_9ROSI|nr:hypothetical protein SLEP1_g52268 [Rubroshorea leprosula]